jgi:ABC-type protease/lipase transport system fused ATPase/permease subunit
VDTECDFTYIQFYLVYYGEVMVKHPDTNIVVLVWHNTKRGILFFAIATLLYRRSRAMNTTVRGEDYCSIVVSMVLQLLPDIIIIILLILLLFHMVVVAFLTMQLSVIVLFIIAMLNSCSCTIHATTATADTATLPISHVKTEQTNRTSSKQPIEHNRK